MKFVYSDITIYRKYYTEIRLCKCYKQSCKGKFLIKKGSAMLVCPDEAFRLGLVKNIKEYYDIC